MAGHYVVKQGDHLSGIAEQNGFTDYKIIWNHPENADLREKRKNPNVLFPGDRLFIPDKEIQEFSRSTDQLHVFVLKTTPLKLRIKLHRFYSKPIANTPCDLLISGDLLHLTSDATGIVEQTISKTVQDATLRVHQQITVKGRSVPDDFDIPIKIGHLNPERELSGQVARLSNLGYYRSELVPIDDAEFVSAVEEFQCDHGLAVDGDCGPATQAKLKEVHGC
jgi:N-acetylmuramoyl-L-alanine amidase